jgi:hypothetical protein
MDLFLAYFDLRGAHKCSRGFLWRDLCQRIIWQGYKILLPMPKGIRRIRGAILKEFLFYRIQHILVHHSIVKKLFLIYSTQMQASCSNYLDTTSFVLQTPSINREVFTIFPFIYIFMVFSFGSRVKGDTSCMKLTPNIQSYLILSKP